MAKRDANWDKVHAQNYQAKAFWDIHWIRKAKDLLESANLIEPKVVELWENYRGNLNGETQEHMPDHYIGTYFMLIAFAVENLLKASIISVNSINYKREFTETFKFPKDLQSHDLVKLAKKAEVGFSRDEEDLLRRLTRSAIWFGRYPVPLKYKHSSGAQTFDDGKAYSDSWFGENDVERLKKFVHDLKERMGIS